MYGQLRHLSTQLIRQFGVPCVVKTESKGQYDPATGGISNKRRVSNKAYCLFDNLAYDFPSYQSNGSGKGASAMVKQGDVMLYITESGKPEVHSIVSVEGETWAIINCQPIRPANVSIIYQCQARRVT
ncbi:hypothetical protein MUU45_001122 [Rodentibacter pneumotropicus]|uniref:Uncharacterized protein n=1 Tax=Rodentibacter pneumotropicus TaxID=758 RepID=A0AAW5LBY9_9PAST|nr:hypothetical protein [Rodentibacter pneumotropicus]MCQ9121573.1 hypothetical protein [Rodentibacter pneumotropicus]